MRFSGSSLRVLVPQPHQATGDEKPGGKDEALHDGDRARNALETGEGEEDRGGG